MGIFIDCVACDGSGFSVNMGSSCPTCEGTGKVLEDEEEVK